MKEWNVCDQNNMEELIKLKRDIWVNLSKNWGGVV